MCRHGKWIASVRSLNRSRQTKAIAKANRCEPELAMDFPELRGIGGRRLRCLSLIAVECSRVWPANEIDTSTNGTSANWCDAARVRKCALVLFLDSRATGGVGRRQCDAGPPVAGAPRPSCCDCCGASASRLWPRNAFPLRPHEASNPFLNPRRLAKREATYPLTLALIGMVRPKSIVATPRMPPMRRRVRVGGELHPAPGWQTEFVGSGGRVCDLYGIVDSCSAVPIHC